MRNLLGRDDGGPDVGEDFAFGPRGGGNYYQRNTISDHPEDTREIGGDLCGDLMPGDEDLPLAIGHADSTPTRSKRMAEQPPPSYHDLHITTTDLSRTSIFNLPYGYEVSCNRVGGWNVWLNGENVGGEYDKGLRLDVDGHVICDSLTPPDATHAAPDERTE